MQPTQTLTARQAALQSCIKIAQGSYVNLETAYVLNSGQLIPADRGLYTELVYGCVKRQVWLDFFLLKWSTRPLAQLDLSVLISLRLGLYQIHFMDRIPAYASVDETVELVKQETPYAAGMVNAILHKAAVQTDWTVKSKKGKAGFLSVTYSHPLWMIQRWLKRFGEQETVALLEANNQTPNLFARVNTLCSSIDAMQQWFTANEIEAVFNDAVVQACQISAPISDLMGEIEKGHLVIQDIGAMLITQILAPQPNDCVLDYCAAPGGKTSHMAALMQNKGEIIACDLYEQRVGLIASTAKRTGASIVQAKVHDGTKSLARENYFDKVLVDAPCSGTGVLRRKVDARWTKEYEQLAALVTLQRALLRNAYAALKPGGRLIYSTCSLEQEENEKNIEWFLEQEPTAELIPFTISGPKQNYENEGYFTILPHYFDGDGFFLAMLTKKSDLASLRNRE
ncbi:MAG TPA: 16S rRNA (cytosine(967)-C(5))-methyltransferase RsmB [Bacillota bacterium]|nr:16S rRNA (cytosine(967)-C(5))-methyltransferase RsmB [Bacillota bacterium]